MAAGCGRAARRAGNGGGGKAWPQRRAWPPGGGRESEARSRLEPVWPEVGLGPSLPQPRATWPGWGGGRRRRRNAGKQQDGAAGEGRVDCALGAWSVRKGGVEGPVWVPRPGRSRLPPVWEAAWTGPGCGRRLSGHETSGRDPGHPLGLAAPFFLTLHSPFCLSPLGLPVLLGERLDQGAASRGLEKCGSRTLRAFPNALQTSEEPKNQNTAK
ncbi:uncharacterized protein LOC143442686 [Arvicanthis niloticus]|uniref:uncharacterized protein LOC143442686 n=1 Tax=Arvicanthis niloticus TaxID=61156 RepID=UPI00403C91DC